MNKKELIEELKQEGFSDKILNAFEKIRREDFIPKSAEGFVYANEPLSIGYGQTISQPYTIAFMLNLLELGDDMRILEVGSGSGYVLALMNKISKDSKIYGIERIRELADISRKVLKNKNIEIICENGFYGLKEFAPYDRILISASASKIPEHLYSQLKENGIMVASVKNSIFQIKKEKGVINKKEFYGFIFVPLVEE